MDIRRLLFRDISILMTVLIVAASPVRARAVTVDELYSDEKGFGGDYDESGNGDKEQYDETDIPSYKVIVENNEAITDVYTDSVIVQHLPYYIHTYFNLCTSDRNAFYRVQIKEKTVKYDKDDNLLTMTAFSDKHPNTALKIEYDSARKIFGISSSLGDYSIAKLEEEGTATDNPFAVTENHDGNKREKPYGTGDVFISQHGDMEVNGWIYFNSNGLADCALNYKSSYTKTQIKKMMKWLDDMSAGHYRFADTATDDVYAWHLKTGYDPMPLLAILKADGGVYQKKAREYYNFGSIKGSPEIPGSKRGFKNCLPEAQQMVDSGKAASLESAALLMFFDDVTRKYWEGTGQITYYRMSFGGYGFSSYDYKLDKSRYPKDWDSAEEEAKNFKNCYLPWWDDAAYCANFNSSKLWCNQCARFYEEIQIRIK